MVGPDKRCGKPSTLFGYLCSEHGEPLRCTKILSNNKQCKRIMVPGLGRCTSHGALGPPVNSKSIRKLADLIDPALHALYDILKSRKASNADKIRAAKEVLDRVEGYAPIKAAGGLPGLLAAEIHNKENTALTFIFGNPEAQRALDVAAREAAKALPVKETHSAAGREAPRYEDPVDLPD